MLSDSSHLDSSSETGSSANAASNSSHSNTSINNYTDNNVMMQSDVLMVLKFQSNSPIYYVAANTHYALEYPSIVTVTQSQLFGINRWRQDEIEQARQIQANNSTRVKIPEFPIEEDVEIKHKSTRHKRMIPELLA